MKVALNGRSGKVGSVLAPAFEAAGHELAELGEAEAMVDFTAPEAAEANVRAAIELGIPSVVGTTGWAADAVDEPARERGVAVLYAPNFAIGAVLMMRFAEQAARYFPRVEVVELHNEAKKDAPSGTAKATAERVGGAEIHSVRLPGLVAHQEVLFGGDGQLLSIRHDAFNREAYVPGVLLALERLPRLPSGLTVGLEAILD
ncbi:MAG TPA: dihydrodipicolinate reductase C-terminal domain-containing protein [Gaiellaceae bacterium]|nr:dihydrodipicolinate reductase C-terminal domain-containing protein [Gaiellaceae bacterium]